jgi:hypothetical protein
MTELDEFLELDVIQRAELLAVPRQIPLDRLFAVGHAARKFLAVRP